jgi:hypothetical protein
VSRQFARTARSQPWVFNGEELPWVGDAFERMGAAISESHPSSIVDTVSLKVS